MPPGQVNAPGWGSKRYELILCVYVFVYATAQTHVHVLETYPNARAHAQARLLLREW